MADYTRKLKEEDTEQVWQDIGPTIKDEDNPNLALNWGHESFLAADSSNKADSTGSKSTGHTIADAHSVLDGGRTFQAYKDGQKSSYYIPNDGPEQDRLDIQHKMFRVLFDDKLGLAPVHEPKHVLDIATGTGIWALDFAEENPKSQVIGTDLSMIQPSRAGVTNCDFIRDDAEDPWIYPHKFDYIHTRAIATCFSDTKAVMKQAFDNMNEGGYLEINDFVVTCLGDETIEGTAIQRWFELVALGFGRLGRDVFRAKYYKQWLEEVGFVDVTEIRLSAPFNSWPKDPKYKQVGRWFTLDMQGAIPSMGTKTLPLAGLSPDECERLVDQALVDMTRRSIHGFTPVYVVYGRKPLAHEQVPMPIGS